MVITKQLKLSVMNLNYSDLNFNVSCTSGKMKNLEPSCFVLFLFCEKKKKRGLKDIYKNRKKHWFIVYIHSSSAYVLQRMVSFV